MPRVMNSDEGCGSGAISKEPPLKRTVVWVPGSCPRKRSSNAVVNYALGALSKAGHVLSDFFTPKSAYAIHLGVGGFIGVGDGGDGGFSYVAPAEARTEEKVSGDGATA